MRASGYFSLRRMLCYWKISETISLHARDGDTGPAGGAGAAVISGVFCPSFSIWKIGEGTERFTLESMYQKEWYRVRINECCDISFASYAPGDKLS